MKFIQYLLFFSTLLIVSQLILAFSCPPKNQVLKINRECRSDKDCGQGICCNDQKNTKSCVMSASQDNYGGKGETLFQINLKVIILFLI